MRLRLGRRGSSRMLWVVALAVLGASVPMMAARGDGPTDPEQARAQERAPAKARPAKRRPRKGASASKAVAPETEHWDSVSERGQKAHGLYVTGTVAQARGAAGVVQMARASRMTAVVLDFKDSAGKVHYDTAIPELESFESGYMGNAREYIRTIKEAGIYVIARIVCFADLKLPKADPSRAIQYNIQRREGEVWRSWGTGGSWLDPYNQQNHDMVVALAREAQDLGVDEVQLDYIRFPVDNGTQYAHYPAERDINRATLLLGLLERIDAALTIPLGVDVFGLAAFRRGDPSGLGQDLERWTRHVEVFTPMLYMYSMRAWEPNAQDRVQRLIAGGVSRLRARIGEKPVIRPFIQAFRRGNVGEETPRFIARQIRAARFGRADGYLFWHPGSRYGHVRQAMVGPAAGSSPFPIDAEVMRSRM